MTTSNCKGPPVTTSQTTSDYEWLRVTTSDYKPLQVTTSDYETVYELLQVTTNDCKRLPVKLRIITTGIGNNLRHKNVYRKNHKSYDYTTMNEVNTLKK